MPTVSILITSYNHEKYIRDCIESAINQTYKDFEIIIIDDNSSDRTRDIILGYSQDATVIINTENQGTYNVLNQGLFIAKGEYCAILNSDDIWLSNKLERQVDLMAQDDKITFCHTFGDFIDSNGTVIHGKPMGFAFPRTTTGYEFPTFVINNSAIASSVLFRTHVVRELGGFDSSFQNLGDWDMWLKLAEAGWVGYVDEKLTLYRVHGLNTIHKRDITWSEEVRIRENVWNRRHEWLSGVGSDGRMRKALAHCAACLGTQYLLRGDDALARQFYKESLRLNPSRFKSVFRMLLTYAPVSIRRKLL